MGNLVRVRDLSPRLPSRIRKQISALIPSQLEPQEGRFLGSFPAFLSLKQISS